MSSARGGTSASRNSWSFAESLKLFKRQLVGKLGLSGGELSRNNKR